MANPIFRLLLILTLCVPVPLHGQGTPPNTTLDKSKFIVVIYTSSPDAPAIKQIAGALFQKGYSVSKPMKREGTVGESVVNYYDESTSAIAKDVVETVQTFVELKLAIRRGRGGPVNGVDVWLFTQK